MKKQLTTEYLELLATNSFATTYHFKILMLLLADTYTQAQLSNKLNIQCQNVHRCVKELEEHGYISVDRVEGRNKFYKATTSVKAIIAAENKIDGQLSIV